MIKKILHKIFRIIVIPGFLLSFVWLISLSAESEHNPFGFLYVPSETKSIFEILFHYPEINRGTKIMKNDSQEVVYNRQNPGKLVDDTSGNKDNSLKVWYIVSNDQIRMDITLKEPNQQLRVYIYNLIGKIVKEPDPIFVNSNYYSIFYPATNLPNGIYLCVVTGNDFRLREKFIISR